MYRAVLVASVLAVLAVGFYAFDRVGLSRVEQARENQLAACERGNLLRAEVSTRDEVLDAYFVQIERHATIAKIRDAALRARSETKPVAQIDCEAVLK